MLGAALVWSVGLFVAAMLWLTGRVEAPFGPFEVSEVSALINALHERGASALLGAVGLVCAGVAAASVFRAEPPGILLLVISVLLTVFTTVVVATAKFMAVVGYTLSLHVKVLDGEEMLQLWMLLGSAVWIAAALSAHAGRVAYVEGKRPSALAYAAVTIAVIIPLLYAAVRFAWSAGIPLGIEGQPFAPGLTSSGLWSSGFRLACVASGVAVLTLGLVQRWGDRFPRWVPALGGRRVPALLAAIPVTLGALVIFTGGISVVRLAATDGVSFAASWSTIGPGLLWPLWGIALAVALIEYLRRRLSFDSGKRDSTSLLPSSDSPIR
ncbi:hypothetical protein GCM10027267_22990 [Paramicrobacterium agarici]